MSSSFLENREQSEIRLIVKTCKKKKKTTTIDYAHIVNTIVNIQQVPLNLSVTGQITPTFYLYSHLHQYTQKLENIYCTFTRK